MSPKAARGGGGLPEGADALLALPPAEFTAARNALAAERAAAGDRAGADAVRRLRRPVGLAWILNRLARERPAEVEALLEAGDALRAGQRAALEGKGGAGLRAGDDALRSAARALREAAAPVLADGRKVPPPQVLARVELLLRLAATGDAETREALRRGSLEREPAPGESEGPFSGGGGVAAAPRVAAPTRGTGGRAKARAAPAVERPAPARKDARQVAREERAQAAALERAEREAAARAREEAARTAREAKERDRAAVAAERALARAEAEVERRKKALTAAEEEVRAARARLTSAEAEVARRRAAAAKGRGRG